MTLTLAAPEALLLQVNVLEMVKRSSALDHAVLAILALFSLFSWAIIFSKWRTFRAAQDSNARFLRGFRKADGFQGAVAASEQYRPSPLVAVFDFGYEEIHRQVKARGTVRNKLSLERSLQLGVSEEIAKLERNLNWLATTASVGPFIGLFGTVLGVMRAFNELGSVGSVSLRAVGPGISAALVATAAGLAAAIPAAVAYNHFGHLVKEIGARMDDFSLEFMNLTERSFED
ncbi:MAG: MotA/TolQ/ExbB proton channel family protein [Acidobacteria bacterium]|nr:MotA/TolQ/ExbB proton channel family protein [Acidobacteriota bacterium]